MTARHRLATNDSIMPTATVLHENEEVDMFSNKIFSLNVLYFYKLLEFETVKNLNLDLTNISQINLDLYAFR